MHCHQLLDEEDATSVGYWTSTQFHQCTVLCHDGSYKWSELKIHAECTWDLLLHYNAITVLCVIIMKYSFVQIHVVENENDSPMCVWFQHILINSKQTNNIYRGNHVSLSWFSCGSSILDELEFGNVCFRGGRKTGVPGEKPSEQGENQQQAQPTYSSHPQLKLGHIGVRWRLSPLSQLCYPV